MTRDWSEIYKVIENTILAEYAPRKTEAQRDKATRVTPKILIALREAGYMIACRPERG